MLTLETCQISLQQGSRWHLYSVPTGVPSSQPSVTAQIAHQAQPSGQGGLRGQRGWIVQIHQHFVEIPLGSCPLLSCQQCVGFINFECGERHCHTCTSSVTRDPHQEEERWSGHPSGFLPQVQSPLCHAVVAALGESVCIASMALSVFMFQELVAVQLCEAAQLLFPGL